MNFFSELTANYSFFLGFTCIIYREGQLCINGQNRIIVVWQLPNQLVVKIKLIPVLHPHLSQSPLIRYSICLGPKDKDYIPQKTWEWQAVSKNKLGWGHPMETDRYLICYWYWKLTFQWKGKPINYHKYLVISVISWLQVPLIFSLFENPTSLLRPG